MLRIAAMLAVAWTFLSTSTSARTGTTQSPSVPIDGRQCEGPQLDRLDRYNKLRSLAQTNPDVIFLGDSITAFLASADGRHIFDRYYRDINAAVLAVSGDSSGNTLWLIRSLPPISPRIVVLLTGANDTRCRLSASETSENVRKIISYARSSWPNTKVILVPTLPRYSDPEAKRGEKLIESFEGQEGVTIVSMRDIFYRSGKPAGLIDDAKDRVHPTIEYQNLMAARLAPVIKMELTRKPISTDKESS